MGKIVVIMFFGGIILVLGSFLLPPNPGDSVAWLGLGVFVVSLVLWMLKEIVKRMLR
jgi:hypothetical protein